MKNLVPYLLLTILLSACATVTTKLEYDQSGKTRAVWRYVEGAKQGKSVLYNEAGEPYFEAYFENGQMQGTSFEYTFFSGKRELAVQYECDHCKGYSAQDNSLYNEIIFSDGQPHGAAIYYYPTGERQKTVHFVHGNRHGQENQYYKNGQLKRTTTFVNGEMDGPQTDYAKNGQLRRRSVIKEVDNYYVHLQTKEYDKSGSLQQETLTNEQGTILFQRHYSSTGALIKQLDYKMKTTTSYDEAGTIISETVWQK